MNPRHGLFAAGLSVLAAMPGGPAQAQTLRIALGLPEVYAAYEPLVGFASRLKSDVGLDARVYAMSLLTLAETAGGVRDGLTDIGFVVFPYHPVEFSEVNLIANLSMLATRGATGPLPGAAMTGATMEYTLLNCPECLAQMKANNQVYLTGASTPPYRLLCTKPISTAEDAKGKRFRAGAANWARWSEAMGGASVTVPGNETYDAMSQGIVDCTISPLGDLVGGRYVDVSTDVTMVAPGGVFAGLGAANVNRDVWQAFTPDQRSGILRAANRLSAEAIFAYHADDVEGLAAAKAKGIRIHEGDATLASASDAFVDADTATISAQFTKQFKLANVDAKIATFRALIDKWKGLTADIAVTDVDRLEKLYWDEVVSKVDPATHGMD